MDVRGSIKTASILSTYAITKQILVLAAHGIFLLQAIVNLHVIVWVEQESVSLPVQAYNTQSKTKSLL